MNVPLLGASVLYHVVHYGLVIVMPAAVLVIVGFAERRGSARKVSDAPAIESRMLQAFGVAAPGAARANVAEHPVAQAQPVDLPRTLLATLSAGAGLIHAGVIGIHLRESSLYGTFFVLAAIAQVAWAIMVLRAPSRRLLVIGIVGNAAVIVLWVFSRSTGLPLGPEPGVAERIGWADSIATAYEAALVVFGSALVLRRAERAREVARPVAELFVLLLLAGAGAAAIWGHRS